MTYRLLACVVGLSALTACAETAPACHDPGTVLDIETGMCVALSSIDGGQRDDAATHDAGPCGVCDAARPVCLVEGNDAQCVQCTSHDDCSTGSPMCSPAHECVQCVEDSDCHDPAAAQCMDGACVPCADSTDCAGTGSATICDTSRPTATCVECTLDDSDACTTGETCDLFTGLCTTIAPASRSTCETCTNDLQCGLDHRCVQMQFPTGTNDAIGHCLKLETAGCTNPYRFILTSRRSVSRAAPANYCGLDEDRATCEAVFALQADANCTSDGMCGERGSETPVRGAICRRVSGTDNKCTYACAGPDAHCPSGLGCGDTSSYCGGL